MIHKTNKRMKFTIPIGKGKTAEESKESIAKLMKDYQEDIKWDEEKDYWFPEPENNDMKDRWLNENSFKSQLLGNTILPMRPNFGFYVSVFDLDISEDMFKEEYDKITEAYFSVIDKMDKHYKSNKKK